MSQQVPPPYTDAPPAYGFQVPPPVQQQQPPTQVVYVHEPATRTVVVTPMMGLGSIPMQTKCPSCHQNIQTRVDQEVASRAHLTALLLCLFGCWPCVCLPYCMDTCKNTNHYCPNCKAFLGTFVAG